MPFVHSRVNGLKIAIPNDAAGVVHRFAIHGGGNELVFQPIKRRDFDASRRTEAAPVALEATGPEVTEPISAERQEAVPLTYGIAEDGDDIQQDIPVVVVEEAAPAKPKTSRRRKATPAVDDDINL